MAYENCVRCLVPFCRGYTRRKTAEYLCSKHYSLVDKALKRRMRLTSKVIRRLEDLAGAGAWSERHQRRWQTAVDANWRAWNKIKAQVFAKIP